MLHTLRSLSRQNTGQGCGTGEVLLPPEMGGVGNRGQMAWGRGRWHGKGTAGAGGRREGAGQPLCGAHTIVHHLSPG